MQPVREARRRRVEHRRYQYRALRADVPEFDRRSPGAALNVVPGAETLPAALGRCDPQVVGESVLVVGRRPDAEPEPIGAVAPIRFRGGDAADRRVELEADRRSPRSLADEAVGPDGRVSDPSASSLGGYSQRICGFPSRSTTVSVSIRSGSVPGRRPLQPARPVAAAEPRPARNRRRVASSGKVEGVIVSRQGRTRVNTPETSPASRIGGLKPDTAARRVSRPRHRPGASRRRSARGRTC